MIAPAVLPQFACPAIFDISGGTRLFCVMGGPGKRMEVERTHGKYGHDLSTTTIVDQPWDMATKEVVTKVAEALPGIIRTPSFFNGVNVDYRPTVWHDGAPKSVMSYNVFKQIAMFPYVDAMKGPPTMGRVRRELLEGRWTRAGQKYVLETYGYMPDDDDEFLALEGYRPEDDVFDCEFAPSVDYFWEHALNRVDNKLVKTVILFCSSESLGRILRGTNLVTQDARICTPSGGIVPITIPIGVQASVGICCGPYGHHAMHWGSTTEAEYRAIHQPQLQPKLVVKLPPPALCDTKTPPSKTLCAEDATETTATTETAGLRRRVVSSSSSSSSSSPPPPPPPRSSSKTNSLHK